MSVPPDTVLAVASLFAEFAAPPELELPAPNIGEQLKFLRADGAWVIPTNTTYSVGTSSYLGITKLYTETGSATDGTMTQNAITSALNGKSPTSHTVLAVASLFAEFAAPPELELPA